jgi:hypothetical protein
MTAMPHHPRTTRPQLIERLRRRLDRDGWPRAQMLLIVMLTGAAGFIASWSLLRFGVHAMALRYMFACLIAYAVFLALLWVWMRTSASDWTEIPDLPHFSGSGGAEQPATADDSGTIGDAPSSDGDGAADGLVDTLGTADEFALPLLLVVALAALVLSSLFVVWTAPVLFAELLIDGVLAASLYRRLRGLEPRHWLDSAVRRTAWPFLATTGLVGVSGWLMQKQAPGAVTIGEALARLGG